MTPEDFSSFDIKYFWHAGLTKRELMFKQTDLVTGATGYDYNPLGAHTVSAHCRGFSIDAVIIKILILFAYAAHI